MTERALGSGRAVARARHPHAAARCGSTVAALGPGITAWSKVASVQSLGVAGPEAAGLLPISYLGRFLPSLNASITL